MKEVQEVKGGLGAGVKAKSLIVRKLLLGFIFLFPLLLCAQQDYVVFSKQGGVYDHPFAVTLQCGNNQYSIHYTLNGNTPTAASPTYSQPFTLGPHLYSSSNFYTIPTAPENRIYIPGSVLRAIVIRAAAFDANGKRVSPVVTQSYFIKSLNCDLHQLPVISLCADSAALFDQDTGILVPGVHLDPENPDWTGNYYQNGREWERLCNVEYYGIGNGGFNQQAGLRTHGGNGRRHQQKGLKIYAREEYGKKRFSHGIFENYDVTSFKHLVLKPFACSWTEAGFEDYLSSLIAHDLNVDNMASRPIVLFLNGEYWGIYFIHEKADERYVEDHYDFDHDFCNIMGNWFSVVEAGEGTNFINMMEWLKLADLSDSIQYQQLCEMIDIDNFIDYQILEIFVANADWPANNMRCWQVPGRKWRWFFYDGDAGFKYVQSLVFSNAVSESTQDWPTNAQSTLMFRKLLQNKSFRSKFTERYNNLINTYLSYNYTHLYLNKAQNLIQDEVARQSERFGKPTNMKLWNKRIEEVDKFLRQRPQILLDSLSDYFNFKDFSYKIAKSIVIYPNPATHQFSIFFNADNFGITRIIIKDMQGRICYKNSLFYAEGENRIPIRCNLRGGTYIVSIGNISKKLVIVR